VKKQFVKVSNVRHFLDAMVSLKTRQEGIPGMALVYGEPGYGKTATALWYVAQDDGAIFIRTKKLMSGRWLLEELVAELGEAPAWRTSDLFRQAQDALLEKPRIVFIDEVDYLTYDARVIETLRDLHDITGAPFVYIGMSQADKKLARYKHLYDRFSQIVKFQPLSLDDVRLTAETICEAKLEDSALKWVWDKSGGKFRRVVVCLYLCERMAKTNKGKVVTARDLEGTK